MLRARTKGRCDAESRRRAAVDSNGAFERRGTAAGGASRCAGGGIAPFGVAAGGGETAGCGHLFGRWPPAPRGGSGDTAPAEAGVAGWSRGARPLSRRRPGSDRRRGDRAPLRFQASGARTPRRARGCHDLAGVAELSAGLSMPFARSKGTARRSGETQIARRRRPRAQRHHERVSHRVLGGPSGAPPGDPAVARTPTLSCARPSPPPSPPAPDGFSWFRLPTPRPGPRRRSIRATAELDGAGPLYLRSGPDKLSRLGRPFPSSACPPTRSPGGPPKTPR